MEFKTDVKCPYCDNNIEASVFDWYPDKHLPSEGGFHAYCNDSHCANTSNYTYQDGVEISNKVMDWFKANVDKNKEILV